MPRDATTDAYDLIPIQVWTAHADGRLDYVNACVTDYFCMARERILERGWQDHCHPLDLAQAMERWARSLATGEPYEVAFRLMRGTDRQYRWHVARATAVRGNDGAISHWVGTNTEIDWLKRAEEVGVATLVRTRREHAHWQAVFAQMPIAVVVTGGPEHRVDYCSDLARSLTAVRELVGRPLPEAFPELAARFTPGQLDAVHGGGETLRLPAGDGGALICCALRRADDHVDGLIIVTL